MDENNKKIIFFGLAVFLCGLAVFYFFIFNNRENETPLENNNISVPDEVDKKDNNLNNLSTSTINSSESVIENTATTSSKPISTSNVEMENIPQGDESFVISLDATSTDEVSEKLIEEEFIKNKDEFSKIFKLKFASPGAYKLSKQMTPSQVSYVLKQKPYMKWVVIPPGLRKEEIAELLKKTLDWTKAEKNHWIKVDTISKTEYIEGVYFPDTYLIPVEEKTEDVAKRLISKFNENFVIYLPQFTTKNIKWTRALTLASIVQREASSEADMPLIAGILWNRLDQNIALGVDATLQYIRGNTGSGYWAPITVNDKKTDSPYNTYMNKGLPPHPIANPGVSAINAVLNPEATECIYYIHDSSRTTHCAATYEEHLENIEKYLKNGN